MTEVTENWFEDEVSKIIFRNKKKLMLTKSGKWDLLRICQEYNLYGLRFNNFYKNAYEKIKKLAGKRLIYGAGGLGIKVCEWMKRNNLQLEGFVDGSLEKKGKMCCGYPVYHVDEISNDEKYSYIIPKGLYSMEMYALLLDKHISCENIVLVPEAIWNQDYMEIRGGLEEILTNTGNHFVFYGESWNRHLFKTMLQEAGIKTDFTIFDEADDSLNLISENTAYYLIVFDKKRRDALLEKGIEKERILYFPPMDDNQYFDEEIVPRHQSGKQEIFIDGGCLNGATSGDFMSWCHGEYEKIIAFEPDSRSAEFCKKRIRSADKENIQLIEKGLWSSDTKLFFKELDVPGASRVDTNANAENQNVTSISVTSIDNVLNGKPATFIKMDIEGSELEALKGAEETIKKYHPVLAISAYHKPEDIVELPAYIRSIDPEYKFYLRSYHLEFTEIVLYAI